MRHKRIREQPPANSRTKCPAVDVYCAYREHPLSLTGIGLCRTKNARIRILRSITSVTTDSRLNS
jgi:hypothetical protein